MFEPEHEDMICPECHNRRVYLDRQMGHYCMFCGRQFSSEEVEVVIEHEFRQIHAALRANRIN